MGKGIRGVGRMSYLLGGLGGTGKIGTAIVGGTMALQSIEMLAAGAGAAAAPLLGMAAAVAAVVGPIWLMKSAAEGFIASRAGHLGEKPSPLAESAAEEREKVKSDRQKVLERERKELHDDTIWAQGEIMKLRKGPLTKFGEYITGGSEGRGRDIEGLEGRIRTEEKLVAALDKRIAAEEELTQILPQVLAMEEARRAVNLANEQSQRAIRQKHEREDSEYRIERWEKQKADQLDVFEMMLGEKMPDVKGKSEAEIQEAFFQRMDAKRRALNLANEQSQKGIRDRLDKEDSEYRISLWEKSRSKGQLSKREAEREVEAAEHMQKRSPAFESRFMTWGPGQDPQLELSTKRNATLEDTRKLLETISAILDRMDRKSTVDILRADL
jgi:hypothetical protein